MKRTFSLKLANSSVSADIGVKQYHGNLHITKLINSISCSPTQLKYVALILIFFITALYICYTVKADNCKHSMKIHVDLIVLVLVQLVH